MKFKLIGDVSATVHFGYDFAEGPQDVKEPEFIAKLENHPNFEKVAAGRPKAKVTKNANNGGTRKKSAKKDQHPGPVGESDSAGE